MDKTLTIWSLLDSILSEYGARIKDSLSDLSLSLTDSKILRLVSSEPKNMKYLADTLSLAKGWVTDITDGLESKNLVKRVHSSQDRRVINIEITEEGLKTYHKIEQIIKGIIYDSISSLPEDDINQLATILEKINMKLKDHS
ncbi:MAG: MarR family transcriptional regulator [Ferroplasma sp. Type II]|uniref:MarR family winged helix-turn-helix transcriptional regulator n=1 Tax=Ferroplasma sp. Type II TaxID=261388 RepID=UPI0003895849|nr:MarR family transcriptional regulator [Ferroplasma sp. Type II]EQB72997.1 MAG: MarR family transcriptional regulator [Ferroplasma sp. Type II]